MKATWCLIVAATVMLLASGPHAQEVADKPQSGALVHAVRKRDTACVKQLLDAGADPNETDGYWGGNKEHWLRTPLIEAARLGEADIARMLLSARADPKKCVPLTGFGPINAALRTYEADSAKILKMLKDAGADLNAPPPDTDVPMSDWHSRVRKSYIGNRLRTCLHQAVAPGRNARRHDPMAAARKTAMLIAAGTPLNNTNGLGQTPLVLLVDEGRFQGRDSQLNVLRELLSHRPDLNTQDVDGRTALHHAVIEMDAEIAKMLLDAGARTDLEDEEKRTPAQLAQEVYPRYDVLTALGLAPEPVPDDTLRPHIHPSRMEGIAPLTVFFDGVATDGLADSDYLNAYFEWNFDTTGVDPGHARKTGIGFNVAHVFRTPGTYTVRMHVVDTAGKEADRTLMVKVLPFEGKTFHVAADGDDNAPGTAEQPWKTPAHALARAESSTRILFRRGDEFESPGIWVTDRNGPVIVGAYNDPANPSDEAPLIVGRSFMALRNVHDWRIMDLHLKGLTTERHAEDSGKAFSTAAVRNVLISGVEIENFGADALTDAATVSNSDALTVTDCRMHDFGAYGFFSSRGTRIAFMGNRLQRMHGFEHGYRTQAAKKSYVAHNIFGKDIGVVKSTIQVRGHAEQTVIAFNRIANTASFAPTNTGTLDLIHDCLADGNIMTSGFTVGGHNITFRRNRMSYEPLEPTPGRHFAQAQPNMAAMGSHMDWPGVSENIRIYNNVYRGPGALLTGAGNDVSAHGNVVKKINEKITQRFWYGGFFVVPHADEEVTSDCNVYYAVNPKTGKIIDLTEWLAERREAGQDRHSRAAEPTFKSLDPNEPGFMIPE